MKRASLRAGFQLAELLLAITLWCAAFLAVMSLYTTCYASVSHNGNLAAAINLAQSQMESTKFLSYSNINSLAETICTQSATYNGRAVTTTFYYTVTVTPNSANTVKDILVEVTWQEKGFNDNTRANWKVVTLESEVVQ